MRAKGSEKPPSAATLIRLAGHAMMGVAMGLCFTLTLAIANPSGITNLLQDAGPDVFIGTLVTTFGIGSALTGAVFMIAEDTDR